MRICFFKKITRKIYKTKKRGLIEKFGLSLLQTFTRYIDNKADIFNQGTEVYSTTGAKHHFAKSFLRDSLFIWRDDFAWSININFYPYLVIGRRKKKYSSVLYRFGQTDAKLRCSYLQVSQILQVKHITMFLLLQI